MAEEFTAKFKVDISDLKKNISEAQKDIKLANATFKAETSGMDKWSDSADGVSKKLDQLKTVLSNQKSILSSYQEQLQRQKEAYEENGKKADTLKTKLKELAENGVAKTDEEYQKYEKALKTVLKEQQNNESAADKLKLSILNQQAAVGGTEKEIRNYDARLDELKNGADSAAKEVDELGKEAKEAGDDAKKGGDGFTVMKGIVADLAAKAITAAATALKDLGKATAEAISEAASYGDEVDKQSQKLGLSTEKYQQLAYAMEMSGADIESTKKGMIAMNDALAEFANGNTEAGATYEALGVSMTNSDGSIKTSEQLLLDTVDALASMEDTTQRDAAAQDIFGKSMTELRPLLNSGAEGIKQLMQEAKDYGMVLSDEAVKASADYNDAMTRLGGTVDGLKRRMVSEFLPGITQVADGLSKMFAGIDGGSEDLKNGINSILEKFNERLPEFLSIGKDVITQIMSGLTENVPNLLSTILGFATELLGAVTGLISELLSHIDEILNPIADAIPQLVETVVTAVPQIIQALLNKIPDIIQAGMDLLVNLGEGILKAIPDIVRQIPVLIQSLVDGLTDGIPSIVQGAIELLGGILQAIPEIAQAVFEAVPQIIGSLVRGLIEGTAAVFGAAVEMLSGVGRASKEAAEEIDTQNEAIRRHADALSSVQPQLADYNSLLSDTGDSLADLNKQQEEAETNITEILKAALKEQRDLREEDIEAIRGYMDQLNQINEEKMQIYRSQQISELKKLQLESGSITAETAAQHQANTEAALTAANQATEDAYTSRLTTIEQKYQAMNQIGSEAYQRELEQAKESYDRQREENQRYYDDAMHILETKSAEWIQKDADRWASLSRQMSAWNTESRSSFENFAINTSIVAGAMGDVKKNYLEALSSMDRDTASSFLNMAASVKNETGTIGKQTATLAKNILGSFDNLPKSLDAAGKDALVGMIYGMEDKIPALRNTSEMSADEIVDTIKDYLGIRSPSRVLKEVGQYVGEGLVDGMASKEYSVDQEARSLAYEVKQAFAGFMTDMYQIGRYVSEGLGDGISAYSAYASDRARGMARAAVDAMKDELSVASPSKETTWIGEMIGAGLARGILGSEDETVTAALEMVRGVTGAFADLQSPTIDPRAAAAGALGAFANGAGGLAGMGSGVNNTNNSRTTSFTQNIYAPKQPSRLELYRQTQNLLSLAAAGGM